jgi:hypothetical protein
LLQQQQQQRHQQQQISSPPATWWPCCGPGGLCRMSLLRNLKRQVQQRRQATQFHSSSACFHFHWLCRQCCSVVALEPCGCSG